MRDTDRMRRRLVLLANALAAPAAIFACDSLGRSNPPRETAAAAASAPEFHGASGKWCAPTTIARVFVIPGALNRVFEPALELWFDLLA